MFTTGKELTFSNSAFLTSMVLTSQCHFSRKVVHRSPEKKMREINVEWNANLVDSRSLFS
jgi:hypothetical protein